MERWGRRGVVWTLSGALLAAAAAGCNHDSGDGTTTSSLFKASNARVSVALLTNDLYVDYSVGDNGSEGSNMEVTLPSLGFTTQSFTDVSATGLSAALRGKDALVIPELENGDLDADLTPGAAGVIVDFVDAGGTLLLFGSSTDEAIALLNNRFGFALAEGSSSDPYPIDAAGAAGTPFQGGPATLPYNDDTTSFDATTLPAGTKVVYRDASAGDAIVALIPYGSGWIVFLGYDWYDGAPVGSQDGGWNDVLSRALNVAFDRPGPL